MHEPQERVEFFHSESSFGSESNLSESRYYDFTNELIAETDNIFLTLKRELQPIEGPAQKDKVEFALRRALILKKDTIPQHIAYLNKIEAPHNARIQVTSCEERLGKLLADNDKLKNGTMIYKQFYNIYGKEFGVKDEQQFSRKKEVLQVDTEPEAIIKPEYIELSYNSDKKKLKGATPRVFIAPAANGNQKETAALRDEVHKLKKALDDDRKHHEMELINEKMVAEKRMRVYLQNTQTNSELEGTLRKELEYYSERLSKSQEEKKKLQEFIEEQTKTIDMLKHENLSLKEQIQILRKAENSFSEEVQPNNRSYNSQANEKQQRKMEKKLKNLAQQNELLKNQLKAERQRLYRLQGDLTDQERRQLERNRKNLQKKKSELEELYADFDKQRIEILQLNYNNKSNIKIVENLKRENDQLKSKAEKSSNSYASPTVLAFPNLQRSLQASKNLSKLQVHEYQGDGLEGFPYYEILNKQFKIRFRRACLKQKQLLYKSNGVEIGVITEFAPPNTINLLIHLTNYSENTYEKVKGKIMNANENKILGETFEFVSLVENQQVKVPVSLAITQYPIGPLILLLEYNTDKKEEIRILLPAHIFKTMLFQPRTENIDAANSAKVAITTERKICKDLNQARQYFNDCTIINGKMKLAVFNTHTHNLLWLDILQTKEGLELIYQHKEGNRHITDYFIKTLNFLLSKETVK